jgi:hypothetical protein
MSVMHTSRRFAATTLACASVMVIGAGCSASDTKSTSSRGVGAPAQGAPQGRDAVGPQAAQGDTAGKPEAGAPAQVTVDSRSLVFTGTVTIRVSDIGRAAADVSTLATAAGGFVGGDDRTSDKDRSQAQLILRVPSARFTDVVAGISKLGRDGKDESRQLSTQDVTDQVTDLDARIATGQASVDRVRELLAKAQNIGEIVSLESELSRREADLESLKSRKRKLDDLTTLSTVTAVLLGPQAAGTATPAKHETGFLAGLKAGWHAFTASMQVLLTVLGALLPWLVGLGLPASAVLWTLRRVRRPRSETGLEAGPETASAPAGNPSAPVAVPAGTPVTAPAAAE